MFSGHKRVHCVKFQVCVSICTDSMLATKFWYPLLSNHFQSVVAPNGLVAHMFGPIEGRRHDAFMLGASGLSRKLGRFVQPNGQPYVLCGDPAYGVSRTILAPYRGAQLSRQQMDFNKAMSRVRIGVDFWEDLPIFLVYWFQEEQQGSSPACRQVLLSGRLTNQLSYLFIWLFDYYFFWSWTTIFGNLFIKLLKYITTIHIQLIVLFKLQWCLMKKKKNILFILRS